MTTRMSLVAVLALLASPAFAQQPPTATDEKTPATQSDQAAPATPVAPPAATEPAPAPAPSADQAAAPAPTAAPSAVASADLRKSSDDSKMVQPWNVTVDTVEDMNILDANGKKIGEVDEVLEDKNGQVKAVAIEYGGFLGFGEKGAIIALDQVQLKDGNLVTTLTEDQLPQQPVWNH